MRVEAPEYPSRLSRPILTPESIQTACGISPYKLIAVSPSSYIELAAYSRDFGEVIEHQNGYTRTTRMTNAVDADQKKVVCILETLEFPKAKPLKSHYTIDRRQFDDPSTTLPQYRQPHLMDELFHLKEVQAAIKPH